MTRRGTARKCNRQITGSFGRSAGGGQAAQCDGSAHRIGTSSELPAACLFSSWLVAVNDDSFCRNAPDEHIHRRCGAMAVIKY
jgi:hypothetical protein